MLENKKSKKESSDTMKVIFLGWMYHCKKCGKTRGIMKHNHKDYSHKRYQELTDKYKKELEEIKEQLIGNYHISMEDSQHQMINLLAHELYEDAEKFYDFEKEISKVTLEEVRELASNVKDDYSFFALVPKE